MLVALIATGVVEGHPVGVNSVSYVAAQPAVVGSEGRIVQSPVLKVIVSSVCVPQEVKRG